METNSKQSVIEKLCDEYDIVGGDNIIESIDRHERYYMMDIGTNYLIRAQRRRVHMLCIKDTHYDEELPLFMMKLDSGNLVTCYSEEDKIQKIKYMRRHNE